MLQLANTAQTAYFNEHDLSRGDEWLNKASTVLRKGDRVYKMAKSEREYLETYSFYKRHQSVGIVPQLVEADHTAWVIVTRYETRFITLHRMVIDNPKSIDKDALQLALIRGLAKFKDASYGKDIQSNLRNIGYEGDMGSIIFFEDNGERFVYTDKVVMIFQFLHMMRNARSGTLLLGNIRTMDKIRVIVAGELEKMEHSENETASEE